MLSKKTTFDRPHFSTSNFKPYAMQIIYKAALYRPQPEAIEFVRIVQDSTGLRKISGTLSSDRNYNTAQSIVQVDDIEEHELEGALKALTAKGFKHQLEDDNKDVLFVQLQLSGKDTMELLELRHQTEGEINRRLSVSSMGRFIAGDLGPGGANMLFETEDWVAALQLILEQLNGEGLAGDCLIAKRVYTAEDDWAYDIVYPVAYEGVFNEG